MAVTPMLVRLFGLASAGPFLDRPRTGLWRSQQGGRNIGAGHFWGLDDDVFGRIDQKHKCDR
jgi:hypothetical protein